MSFLADLEQALPPGLSLAELKRRAPDAPWEENPQEAALHALADGLFDGQDYLGRYPDVENAGVDPVWHFVTSGIAEKREFRIPCNCPGAQAGAAPSRQFDAEAEDSISVIIPAYNVEKYLGRAVESVLAQSHANLEIIIYEDMSEDNTRAVALDLAEKHDVISVILAEENTGQGRGRNLAMEKARGKFITFVDADDYYNKTGFLVHLLAELRKNRADVVISPYQRSRQGKLSQDNCSSGLFEGKRAAQLFLDRNFGTHGPVAKLFRADIARKCRFSEYGYSQDVPFVIDALRNARRVFATTEAGYVYDNDPPSSWRPVEPGPLHFYSSLRILIEVYLRMWGYDEFYITRFVRTWRKEHGIRIRNYLASRENLSVALQILSWFSDFASELEQALPELRYYMSVPISASASTPLPPRYREYIGGCAARIKRELDNLPHPEKPEVVIWCEHLAGGGLERVASQLGNALSEEYDVTWLLEKPEQVDYEINGKVLSAFMFNTEVHRVLRDAAYIFDFRWKNPRNSFPLCQYILERFNHKYIPTIHNTVTCARYWDVIAEKLARLGKSAAEFPAIFCVSEAVRQAMLAAYGKMGNLQVVHNPVELARCDAAIPVRKPYQYMLFCGRLNATEHKGIDLLVQAYKQSEASKRIRLVMAGAGDLERDVLKYILDNGMERQIETVGFTDQIYSLMKGALFTVAPSRWEGFGNAVVESLACGIPVIATKDGIAPEVVRHEENGYLLEPGHADSLAEAIDFMTEHAPDMRDKCRESVVSLDIEGYKGRIQNAISRSSF